MTTSPKSARAVHPPRRAAEPDRFRTLPPRVRPEEMVETQTVDGAPDPNTSRDYEIDWLRSGVWAGG